MKEKFISIFKEKIKRSGAEALLAWLESSDFFVAPASTKYHLARPQGLLEHSVNVYIRMRENYIAEKARAGANPELSDAEEETLAICGLLHDMCKVDEYVADFKNQKTYDKEKVAAALPRDIKRDAKGEYIWESVEIYTHDNKLPYGHGEKSVYIISGFMRLSRDEAMAIRWHMGFSDTSFKGGSSDVSTAFRLHPLALLLHMADLQATFLDETE